MKIVATVLLVLACTWPTFAQDSGERRPLDQPGARKAAPASKATRARKPAAEAPAKISARVRESYAALSEADRRAIQFDLIWTGDYDWIVNAEVNDRVIDAVKSFQRNRRNKETGVLNPQERAQLAAAAKVAQDRVSWRIIDDPVTGAKVGLPTKEVPQSGSGKSGTRWSSGQGQVQVETFRVAGAGTTLSAVHAQQKKEPQRKFERDLLGRDFFILTGLQAGVKKFHVRAHIQGSEVRGLTILYDQFNEPVMDSAALAMSSAFIPFGPAGAVPAPKRQVEYGTGIVVSNAGHVVTDRQIVDECQFVTVTGLGNAEVVAEDKATDLALIRVYGVPNLTPITLAGEPPKGSAVTLVGIVDPQSQAGGNAISTILARLGGPPEGAARTVEPAPATGFSGAAAIDGQGRLIGMAELKAAGPATFVPVTTIRTFLEANNIKPAAGRPGVEEMKAAVVRVICVRK